MTIEKKPLLTLLLYCIKQMDSMLTCVCSGIDYKTTKCGKCIRSAWHTRLTAHVSRFRSYHILKSSVIYLTEQTHGNMESIC